MRNSDPTSCIPRAPAALAAVALAANASCKWPPCVGGAWHCIEHSTSRLPSSRSVLKGMEWEGGCKRFVRERLRPGLDGSIVSVAGLFFGDWLPPLSAVVGEGGTVFGFEPTNTVRLANATMLANRLPNVRIAHACLSNRSSVQRMCTRRAHNAGGAGGTASILREPAAAADCLREEVTPCHALDAALPWRKQRVGMVLLDVEGHEAEALDGAVKLIRKWRPVLALERKLNAIIGAVEDVHASNLFDASGRSIFREGDLDYGGVTACDGLHFYASRRDSNPFSHLLSRRDG